MGLIALPQRHLTQPQYAATIDRQGLGKGVQLLFNPALGPVDMATGRIWTPGGAVAIAAGDKGKTYSFSTAGDYYGYTGYPEITSNVGTFFMWMPVVGAADTNGHVYFAASSPNVCGHQVNQNSQIIVGTGSGGSSGTLPSWFSTSNRSMVLVSDGTAAGTKAFVDGIDTGFTWGSPPTAWGSGSKNFNFGRYVGAAGFQFTGSMLSIGMTSAVWGAAEAKAFHDSKGNALFKAPDRRLWVSAAVGGTTYLQSLTGSLTATGGLTKQTRKPLAGSSTATGALSRLTAKYPTGSITSTGNIVKQTAKTYTGSITGTGAVSTMILFTAAVAGSITATGAIAKMTLKALTGSSTLSGTITKMTSKGLSASITLSGALNKLTTKAFAGSITVTGALFEAYQVMKSLAGSITPAGALVTAYIAFVAGVLKLMALMGVGQ